MTPAQQVALLTVLGVVVRHYAHRKLDQVLHAAEGALARRLHSRQLLAGMEAL